MIAQSPEGEEALFKVRGVSIHSLKSEVWMLNTTSCYNEHNLGEFF